MEKDLNIFENLNRYTFNSSESFLMENLSIPFDVLRGVQLSRSENEFLLKCRKTDNTRNYFLGYFVLDTQIAVR